ncbi:bifunctional diguanylate cyclase/phosphodiesterase [Sulfurospirillum halorespirans]|uniref:Putative diguanylate cyclase n=1 Tax=Sulfurospirillum halorespirans DSM 13726 TaxID=1193502 RepID=A0A1D7THP7_9BACT|nr:PAS domain S-box protein [Sulfurospirillum halorespirans]AOO64521.1 putative diguanylate cyclase [Sulfurospirillum halorespirans DSM 13726]
MNLISTLFHTLFASDDSDYNALYRFFDKSSSIMLLLDPENGKILNANEAAARYYGYTLEQLRQMSISTINTLPAEQVREERQRALKEERNYFNFQHQLANGEVRDVEVFSTPINLKEKRVLFSIIHDITDRKNVERELFEVNDNLAKQEILFKQILDTSSVAIFLVNLEGRITHANQRMAEMFLYPLEELINKEYVELIHVSEKEIGRQKMLSLLSSKIASVDLERVYCRTDGSSFWGQLTGKRFYDTKGEEIGLVGVIADIDERKYIQQCEQHHKQILQMIANTSPLSTILHVMTGDIESIHHHRIGCSMLLFDETNHKLILGATSNELQLLSTTLIDASEDDKHFLAHLMQLPSHPVLFSTLDEEPWWHEKTQNLYLKDRQHCFANPVFSAFGKPLGLLMICSLQEQPLTPREIKLVEDEVQFIALAIEKSKSDAKLQLAANVFTHAKERIIITDPYGTIIEANDAFVRNSGYLLNEIIGHNPRIMKSGRQEPIFYTQMWESILTLGHWQGEIWNRRKDGSIYAEMLTISAVKDSEGEIQNFVALFTDITIIKEHEKELEHLAHHDALTSLPNRMLLWDRLSQAIAEAQRYNTYLAVLYIDLDGFKEINDTYGHSIGDELLIAVSKRIASLLRKNETVARLGGDEFVAILTNLKEPRECEPILKRIIEAMSDVIVIHGIDLYISASIGISFYPDDSIKAEDLILYADKAMYNAKELGKNCYFFFNQIEK